VPVPFIRSIGFGGLLIPLLSVVVCLTLLPLVLRRFGERLAWPRRRSEHDASPRWTGWARWVVRRDVLAAVVGLVVIGALALSALQLRPGDPTLDALATSGPARSALVELERSGAGPGTLTPIEVVADAEAGGELQRQIAGLDGVQVVRSSRPSGGRVVLDVLPDPDGASSAGSAVRERVAAVARPGGAVVGGRDAQTADLSDAIYGAFPLMVVLIALITFVLLARAFRSVLLPLKAVALNVLSVAASWGLITLVWQEGHGSELLFGIPATGAITTWVPLAIFAFLYGLSMDYEVFILARVRESYDATGSTPQAVVGGLGRTGRLVTSAALILFLAFVALAASPGTDIKVLATGLAAGILLDATVVRALVVPALVTLFGRWNWWLGERWGRALRVEPSLPPREGTGNTAPPV
jgi:putative drug exporter of the RND superfamily